MGSERTKALCLFLVLCLTLFTISAFLFNHSDSNVLSNSVNDVSDAVSMEIRHALNDSNRNDSNQNETKIRDVSLRRQKRLERKLKRQNRTDPHPLTVTNTSDLIIFLHFHKAGGTSIVNAAKKSQNLYNPNGNGNPKFYRGFNGTIPFWTYSREMLRDFVSQCLFEKEATFIASENNWFLDTLMINNEFKRQNGIQLVTQLRDPFSRFVSNFFFDLKSRFIRNSHGILRDDMSLIDKLRRYHNCSDCLAEWNHWNAINDWNMYVRVLSSKLERSYNVTEYDLEIAKKELDKFDLVIVLERSDAVDLWESKYGMVIKHSNINKKYEEIYAAERKKNTNFDQKWTEFEEEFKKLNRFDYKLYQYAIKLHQQFARKFLIQSSPN